MNNGGHFISPLLPETLRRVSADFLSQLLSDAARLPLRYSSYVCTCLISPRPIVFLAPNCRSSSSSNQSRLVLARLTTCISELPQIRPLKTKTWISAPHLSLWDMWWTNWHWVPVSVSFQQCSFWFHLVSCCRVGPFFKYSDTLSEE
jgi:hypothetical protein